MKEVVPKATYLHNELFWERFERYTTPPSIVSMSIVAHTSALTANTAAAFNTETRIVCQNQSDRRKIWNAETSRGVPTASSWKAADTAARRFGRAPILTFSDINKGPQMVYTERVSRKTVEQGVEEAKRWLSALKSHVVELRYECTKSGRCGSSSSVALK